MATLPDPIWEPIRIVYGVYRLTAPWAGDDRWWIQRLVESDSGWMVHGDLFLDGEDERYITLDVELTEAWGWRYLHLRDDRGLRVEAEVADERLTVAREGEVTHFPFDDTYELDFLSPFMNSLTLRRLRLTAGQEVTRPVIWFDPDHFVPHLVQQSYRRAAEDRRVEVEGLVLDLQVVTFENHTSGFTDTLLVREDGLVVRYPGAGDLVLDERATAGRGRMPPLNR